MIEVKKESLGHLKQRWEEMVAQNPSMQPYQEYEMVRIIQRYYLPFTIVEKEYPVFFSLNENGKTIAIAPMARRIGDRHRYANFGKAPTIAVKDFIYPSDMGLEKMGECLAALKSKLGPIHFYDVPEYSTVGKALEKTGKRCKDHIYTTILYLGGVFVLLSTS